MRRAGYLQRLAAGQPPGLRQVLRPESTAPARVPHESHQGTDPDLAPARFRLLLATGAGRIGLVDVDRDVRLQAEAIREADVVGVAMGDQQGAYVGERAAHRCQLGEEVVPLAGEACVDDGHAAGILDQVGGDDVVADAVERWRELHGVGSLGLIFV